MRSELVTQAAGHVDNRFLLVHVASAITRKFHRRTKDRMPESINNSLAGIGEGKYFVWPDRTIAGIITPEQTAVAIATGQLRPAEATAITGVLTFAFPLVPAKLIPADEAVI